MRAAFLALAVMAPAVVAQPPRPAVVRQDSRCDESANFRLFHSYDKDYGDRVLKLAENYRTEIGQRWFGTTPPYRVKCDIHLHTSPNAQPGFTNMRFDHDQAVYYRVDLRVDIPIAYTCVLPHEIMHTILGAHFGRAVPRWADEGIAAQTETAETIAKSLKMVREATDRFALRTVLTLADYPRARVDLFYAQSAVVVRHLVRARGERAFITFLDDLHKDGVDAALWKHYQLNCDGLEAGLLTVPAPKDETQPDR